MKIRFNWPNYRINLSGIEFQFIWKGHVDSRQNFVEIFVEIIVEAKLKLEHLKNALNRLSGHTGTLVWLIVLVQARWREGGDTRLGSYNTV